MRPTILLVDDNPDLLDNLSEILDDAGYESLSAGSMKAALEQTASFELALVDLRLPDGDGTALAVELKKRQPHSEVILLTGHATVESAASAVRAGACAYLVKPVDTNELLLTLEQAMRQVRLHLEKVELARRAQTAEKLAAVGTLTAGLSHEIRNPLNAAALQLQVLERRIKKLPAEQQPALLEPFGLVRDEVRRLDHVLEDFLQFARPASFVPQSVDLSAMLAKVEALFRAEAEQRGVTLCARLPADEGARRRGPAAAGGGEPGGERDPGDAVRRRGLGAHRGAGRGGRVHRAGQRAGDSARARGSDLRAVLHHQARGQRPRALDRPRDRAPARGHDLGAERAGPGRPVHGAPPGGALDGSRRPSRRAGPACRSSTP